MHIKKGEQSSFTSLGDWMKDEAMFNLISQIKYFRTYLIGRCFRRWHKVYCLECSMTQMLANVTIQLCHGCTMIMDSLSVSKQAAHPLADHVNMSSLCRKFAGNFLPECATASVANCFLPSQHFASTWLRSTSSSVTSARLRCRTATPIICTSWRSTQICKWSLGSRKPSLLWSRLQKKCSR